MYFGEYEQYNDFYYDFYNIYYGLMHLKVASLPNFREIVSTRYRFLNNKIKGLKEREQAKKLLNSKQLEFYEENEKQTLISKSMGTHSYDVSSIQEKNRKKMEERGIKWQV